VWTGFSFPPPKLYDVSQYGKVALEIRVGDASAKPAVFVGLATGNVKRGSDPITRYDWCEYEIPSELLRNDWTQVEAEFSRFEVPSFSPRDHELHTRQVFRMVLAFKAPLGTSLDGHLDVDNIRFVR
jgi:hypothetical protein